MEVIEGNAPIECDLCGNKIHLTIQFLSKVFEKEYVIICSDCIHNGGNLIYQHAEEMQ